MIGKRVKHFDPLLFSAKIDKSLTAMIITDPFHLNLPVIKGLEWSILSACQEEDPSGEFLVP
jgi:hypothetical protein